MGALASVDSLVTADLAPLSANLPTLRAPLKEYKATPIRFLNLYNGPILHTEKHTTKTLSLPLRQQDVDGQRCASLLVTNFLEGFYYAALKETTHWHGQDLIFLQMVATSATE